MPTPHTRFGHRRTDESPELRRIVFHADDFGMSEAVTGGILEGFRRGLLTSTSVLANAPGCAPALAHWKALQEQFSRRELPSSERRLQLFDSTTPFDLGIHLNLTQGRPLTAVKYPAELLDREGRFPGIGALALRLLTGGWKYRDFLEQELKAQIEMLLDHGISPTQLNAHQYVDLFPVVASLVPSLMRRFAIPVVRVPWERHLTRSTLIHRFEPFNWGLGQIKRLFAFHHLVEMNRRGIVHPAGYFGTSHAGRIDMAQLMIFLRAANGGLTEVGMHPGLPVDGDVSGNNHDGWQDPLAKMRPAELALLTLPELSAQLERYGIRLGRLSDLAARNSLPVAA